MRSKQWFFWSVIIILAFITGRASAEKPKTVAASSIINIPKYQAPKWEPILQAQLARREAQEQARIAQIEAARVAEAARLASLPKPTPKPIENAVIKPQPVPTGDAKAFIYMHESGNNPKARNSAGCLGLGQACPGSKLLAVCPNLDYACEDQFFTNYMLVRYRSWENARAFWLAHNWW